ncbi:MAG TPA: hypothetical protein VHX40_05685 [Acidimicrobiales bacterium]|nr:hypothetical protein [Acidimicrobiales bacterium]
MGTTDNRSPYDRWWRRWAPAIVAGVVLAAGVSLLVTPLVASAASRSVTVAERHVGSLGTVLVDRSGQTLYIYTTDRPERVTCTGRCAAVWPPFLLRKGVTKVAGPHGAVLGTIHRPGGRLQVTSHRLPLYRYVGDRRPGQINGEGVEGTWFVATPSGRHPASSPATPPSTSSTVPAVTPSTPAAGQGGPTSTQPPSPATPGAGAAPPPTTPPPTTMPTPPPSTHTTTPATPSPTSPPPTSPPATKPPPTSPPPTTPPATTPPATTPTTQAPTPAPGGVAY